MATSSGLAHRSQSDAPPPILVEDMDDGRGARRSTFAHPHHRRKHSPSLEWRAKWTADSWKQGRVLLIDYVDTAHTLGARRKIVAQEFCDIDSLRRFYRNGDLSGQAALRVIHVQNAGWATRFLLRKFNIDARDDLVGTKFGRWAQYDRPQQRGGKPVLNGKTFRAQHDPWRGISRAAFGCDYLKHYERGLVAHAPFEQKPLMELNHYDDADQPVYGYDAHVQRLSVYVQLSNGRPGQALDPDIPNPYNEEAFEEYQRLKRQYGNVDANEHREKYVPQLRTLDNGSTIIIFENAVTGSVKDTLIGARQELESRWRRLTFYLAREETENDESLTTLCMDFILKDIFKAIAYNWDKFLNVCETHVSILEDKIYENPADESRAAELWKNSAQWLKVERLMYIHADVAREMRSHLHELFASDPHPDALWLGNAPDGMEKLTGQWERDIVGPTSALSDLMYKSVGIRDARHSLQLGLSMWRLSWITFIFLPLTFTVGFFGMNVDVFAQNPPIQWWLVTSMPVLAIVMILWYAVKHTLSSQRQNPLRRGVYEALYHEFASQHATLWTRGGPQQGIVPVGWWGRVRWRLITAWFGGDKLRPARGVVDPATEEFGSWSRVKRCLARRWLADLVVMPRPPPPPPPPADEAATGGVTPEILRTRGRAAQRQELGAVAELLRAATPVAVAELDPTAASRMAATMPTEGSRGLRPARSRETRPGSSGRPSSDGGVMVEEEKGASEDERSGDEEVAAGAAVEERKTRLNGPGDGEGELP